MSAEPWVYEMPPEEDGRALPGTCPGCGGILRPGDHCLLCATRRLLDQICPRCGFDLEDDFGCQFCGCHWPKP